MDLQLGDKIVLITGASKGIGYACAEAFAAEGSQVALVSRSRENLDAAIARMPRHKYAPIAIVADLTRAEDARLMVDTAERDLGPVDVLVTENRINE